MVFGITELDEREGHKILDSFIAIRDEWPSLLMERASMIRIEA